MKIMNFYILPTKYFTHVAPTQNNRKIVKGKVVDSWVIIFIFLLKKIMKFSSKVYVGINNNTHGMVLIEKKREKKFTLKQHPNVIQFLRMI